MISPVAQAILRRWFRKKLGAGFARHFNAAAARFKGAAAPEPRAAEAWAFGAATPQFDFHEHIAECRGEAFMWAHLAAAVVLLVIVGAGCLALQALKKGRPRGADGQGRITGRCGESVAIGLSFRGERVVEAAARSDGCAYSCTCALAAARLAKGRTAVEVLDIGAAAIERAAGGVPADHRHCATLAAAALQAAVDDYMQRRPAHTGGKSPA